jgi:DNA-binding MarR family transcriptional regulator
MLALLNVAHAWGDRLDSALSQSGLSVAKLGVLTQLVEAGQPLPLSALAARLSCVRSNMTQLVDRLEADGLVRRVDDPDDRRSVRALVTRLGEERQAVGAAEMERVMASFAATIPPADCSTLRRVLGALSQ